MITFDIKKLLSELTLEEKAGLCSGVDFWHTKPISRLGIPSVMVSDGPHGLRKQTTREDLLDIGESAKAVCFPTAAALACSFDRDLLHKLGIALGEECQAEDISTLLGPAVNMKRSPLCGRNFEYFSEDPYLTGELAASYVNGVQSKNIGTSVKHFAVNNQETKRMSVSAEVDERSLREIYLAAFETIVKKAQPWTLMCSYNCINGVYSCENDWLLNQVLRKEWGFEGLVMTDWGAMNDRIKALKAGLDLEMPSSNGITDKEIVKAVQEGRLTVEELDLAVKRILELIEKYVQGKQENATYDFDEHHKLARNMANECAVLLKNDNQILPLKKETKVAFIGEFAASPRYQGGGSSHINSYKVTCALDSAVEYNICYAQGFEIDNDELSNDLKSQALKCAQEAEVAVIFAGLPDIYESEGYDRTHLSLPPCQNILIEEITNVQPNTVVILHNGSPIEMPWVNKVKGILEVYLSGQAVGESTIDLLYGIANPSGKLAETFPLRLQDTPSYLNFPGTNRTVEYREGIFIGYRYYDSKEMDVLFPFGHGLSYTSFEYKNLSLEVLHIDSEGNYATQNSSSDYDTLISMSENDILRVSVTVKNTGDRFGKEIIQLYVKDNETSVIRPLKELKGFEKVALSSGNDKVVSFLLDKRAFAYYNTELQDWHVESGEFEILIGKSSKNIVLSASINVENSIELPFVIDDRTTLSDVLSHVKDTASVKNLIKDSFGDAVTSSEVEEDKNVDGSIIWITITCFSFLYRERISV